MNIKVGKWHSTDEHQNAFNTTKQILSKEVILSYPNFNQPLDKHTNACHSQLGVVLSQNNNSIAFYSRKLNPAQKQYTSTERELLAIAETLMDFSNILLGHKIWVYTDYKNLSYPKFNTERVIRWHLIVEEYGPELHYVPGNTNLVADVLSHFDIANTNSMSQLPSQEALIAQAELFGQTKSTLPANTFQSNWYY
jgi:hypothetical protein